ncbi:GNAT family N-acetyltransferase [Streptomyces koyangensis]|uniref:GNAT family N-acetyltransferase n=1 Tax=Streptomyces koyangensis TaxID=188770 RepID=UPI003C2D0032
MGRLVQARAADVEVLAGVLASAYRDDPVWAWLMPRDREWRLRLLFRGHLAQQIPYGRVWTDEGRRVVCVWAEPGAWKLPTAYLLRNGGTLVRAGRGQLPRVGARLLALERRHPRVPAHWYVEFLGTRAEARGTGLGGVVLGGLLERADTDGRPVFLESSNERNLGFYQRLGFVTERRLTFRSGPDMWAMWRHGKRS